MTHTQTTFSRLQPPDGAVRLAPARMDNATETVQRLVASRSSALAELALPAPPKANGGSWSWAFRLLPALSSAYWLCEQAHLFELGAFRRLYTAFYFHYKDLVEDPFAGLVTMRPEFFRSGHIVDVGAHIGYTTSLFLRELDAAFRIFAIEPDSANARILRETIDRLGAARRVVAVESAAGGADGTVPLWHNTRHPGDNRVAGEAFRSRRGNPPTRLVPARSVDSILAEHGADADPLAFAKIDVQGCETAVCEGLRRTLARSPRAAVAVEFSPAEIEDQGSTPEALLSFFRDRRYEINLLNKNGAFAPLTPEGLRGALQRRGYADLLCLPPGAR